VLRKIRARITEPACLARSAGGVCLGVEVEHQRLPAELIQRDRSRGRRRCE
jgi:hypothetical protein